MLQMSDKFENDTVGNNLSLFPLVVITFADSGEKLYISTNNVSFDDNYYKPILLNVPNVKESIDLENRKYKISNANLSINNFPVSGEVFSDSLLDSSGNYIINAEVDIYWKSQSCVVLDDCLHPSKPFHPDFYLCRAKFPEFPDLLIAHGFEVVQRPSPCADPLKRNPLYADPRLDKLFGHACAARADARTFEPKCSYTDTPTPGPFLTQGSFLCTLRVCDLGFGGL